MSQDKCHTEQDSASGNCHAKGQPTPSCHSDSGRPDFLLWGSLAVIVVLYGLQWLWPALAAQQAVLATLATTVFELMNTMWWGVVLGILMVAVLVKVPREFVMSVLGHRRGVRGILRATAAGLLLDLCNHGILMVAAKLYERGASIGQVMAFLIASPWNSFSLTLILIALIGFGWTLAFVLLSMLIAIVVGLACDLLVLRGRLPDNPHRVELPENFHFWSAAWQGLKTTRYDAEFFRALLMDGVKESRMVLRWIFFGVVLAALVRALVPAEYFGTYFGPTMAGLGLTVLVATLLEVCSEGSTPIAADLLSRANAPGNSFAFLMTGVATDYTEVMVLKDTTRSWRIALALPLLSVPQVLLIAWLINQFAV